MISTGKTIEVRRRALKWWLRAPRGPRLSRPTLPTGDICLADHRRLIPLPNQAAALLALYQAHEHELEAYQVGAWHTHDGLYVQASLDPTRHGRLLHVSCAYNDHLPTWEELLRIRSAFYPPATGVMQVLPRAGGDGDAHLFIMHLWEMPDHLRLA